MTQIERACAGAVTAEMEAVARAEQIDPETVRREVAEGRMVIPANVNHLKQGLNPIGIGTAARTKINANIGKSAVSSDPGCELEKLFTAVRLGSDTVMDLSTGEQIDSEVIFAREGLNLTQKRPMTPQYARGLAEAARFYRRALEGRVSMRQVQEVMMSSEFSVLLGDTLDRVLLAKYATYAPTYRQFLRGRTVRDFRAVGSVRRNTGGRLSPVPEGGDYQQEGLTEESFTYAVKKYGKGYPLTWR